MSNQLAPAERRPVCLYIWRAHVAEAVGMRQHMYTRGRLQSPTANSYVPSSPVGLDGRSHVLVV